MVALMSVARTFFTGLRKMADASAQPPSPAKEFCGSLLKEKVVCAPSPISPPQRFFFFRNRRGITLLEILIALLITAGVVTMGVSSLNRRENRIKKTFRRFMALNRQLDYLSRLKRETRRLVIEIGPGQKSFYWVEKQQNPRSEKPLEEKLSSSATSSFVIDPKFFKKPKALPGKLFFESVELSEGDEPLREGKAYIHYFPEGQFSMALIQIKGRRSYWSLLIDRFRGELTVLNGKKSLKDFEP